MATMRLGTWSAVLAATLLLSCTVTVDSGDGGVSAVPGDDGGPGSSSGSGGGSGGSGGSSGSSGGASGSGSGVTGSSSGVSGSSSGAVAAGPDAGNPAPDAGLPHFDGGSGTDAAGGSDASSSGSAGSHPAWPQVPDNGGPLLQPVKIVAVVASGDPLASSFFAFIDGLASSSWWKTVTAEYGVGTVRSTVHVTGPAMTSNPDDNGMDAYVEQAISGTPAAAPDGQTLYVLFLPPGIVGVDPKQGPNTGCQLYAGYHWPLGTGGDVRAVVQRCPLQAGGPDELGDATITASHEIVESVTDPASGTGWNLGDPSNPQPWTASPWIAGLQGEIGDLCTGTEWTEGAYDYQRIWSNAAAATGGDPCKPAYSSVPYYNTSAPQGWYTVSPGGTIDIPLTGFSTGTISDWSLYATLLNSSDPGYTATISSPKTVSQQGVVFEMINNGKNATMTVTAPAGAGSGSWAVFGIQSVPEVGVGGDPQHLWPVGVHVP
jgi:hypothetical protein